LKIFKHANENQYENILILEDDFIFHKDIKNKNVQKDVCDFVNKYKNTDFQYLLGCIPIIKMPYTLNGKHYKPIMCLGTHACIYSKKNRIKILNVPQQNILDWDYYSFYNLRYMYYRPLCYQLFPETENSKTWCFLATMLKHVFNLLKLDEKVEPGYSIFYIFSKMLFFILLFVIFYLLYLLYLFIYKK